MKLRKQAYLFIGLPLLLQLGITACLFVNVASLEKKISEEAFAKRVITLSNRAQALAAEGLVSMSTIRYSDVEAAHQRMSVLSKKCIAITTELRDLAAQDPSNAELIRSYADIVDHLQTLFIDILGSNELIDQKTFSTVFRESDFNIDFVFTFSNMAKAEKALRQKFSKQVEDMNVEGIRKQERDRFLLAGASVVVVSIAFLLALYLGKSTVGRLELLMSNVQAFSKGLLEMRSVSGNDEIAALNEQFQKIAKLRLEAEQERGAVLQAVSHDIRGPVGTLNLAIMMLLRAYKNLSEEEVSQRLIKISAESIRLVDLCNTFLDLEKFDSNSLSIEMRPVNILLLLENVRESAEGLTNETQQEIEIDCDPELEIQGDESRLMQILVNLISNASKFSPNASTIHLAAFVDEEGTTISVRDEGSGIPADEAEHLFEKFSQLKNAAGRSGSGLGLWICKRLIEMHNGKISCHSGGNQGTTFKMVFPKV